MSVEDLPQEMKETLSKKAGIRVLTIENSENVSMLTNKTPPEHERITVASPIISIAPSTNTSHNILPTIPHKVGS